MQPYLAMPSSGCFIFLKLVDNFISIWKKENKSGRAMKVQGNGEREKARPFAVGVGQANSNRDRVRGREGTSEPE